MCNNLYTICIYKHTHKTNKNACVSFYACSVYITHGHTHEIDSCNWVCLCPVKSPLARMAKIKHGSIWISWKSLYNL